MVPTDTIHGTRSWKSTHENHDYCSFYLNESDSILVLKQLEISHSYDPKVS